MSSTVTQGQSRRGVLNTAFGFRARGPNGIAGEFEYGTSGAAGSLRAQTVRGSLRMAFWWRNPDRVDAP